MRVCAVCPPQWLPTFTGAANILLQFRPAQLNCEVFLQFPEIAWIERPDTG